MPLVVIIVPSATYNNGRLKRIFPFPMPRRAVLRVDWLLCEVIDVFSVMTQKTQRVRFVYYQCVNKD